MNHWIIQQSNTFWNMSTTRGRIEPGVTVEYTGFESLYVTNALGVTKQKKKKSVFRGTVVRAVNPNEWLVSFPNRKKSRIASTRLKVIENAAYAELPTGTSHMPLIEEPIEVDEISLNNPTINVLPFQTDNDDESSVLPPIGDEDDNNNNVQLELDADDQETVVEDDVEEDIIDDEDNLVSGNEASQSTNVHQIKREKYLAEKKQLLDSNYSVRKVDAKTRDSILWAITESSEPDAPVEEFPQYGLRDFKFSQFVHLESELDQRCDTEFSRKKNQDNQQPTIVKLFPYFNLFVKLWPGCWKSQLSKLNNHLSKAFLHTKQRSSAHVVLPVSPNEWFIFIGIMVTAAATGGNGLKSVYSSIKDDWKSGLRTVLPKVDFTPFMPKRRFQGIQKYFVYAFFDSNASDIDSPNYDPYHPVIQLIKDFNANRKKEIAASSIKVLDESMSAFKPRTTPTGGLPNISFIQRKPEPLGTEFKTVACGKLGVMLYLEIQRGKTEMPKRSRYFTTLGATASCTKRLVEDTANCGQKQDVHRITLVLGDSWFASVKTAKEVAGLGHEWIGPVKTARKLFPKDEIEGIMKNWPGGSFLVLEEVYPQAGNEQPTLLAIGYKYNARKVLCFVATKNAGSTSLGKPYSAKFLDSFGNLVSRPVDRPKIISNYFTYCNAIDVHNQLRQYHLALEKCWVTTNCWFRIITTVIGMTVTDCFKLYMHKFPTKTTFKITDFVQCLGYELLHNNESNNAGNIFVDDVMSPYDVDLENLAESNQEMQPHSIDFQNVVEIRNRPSTVIEIPCPRPQQRRVPLEMRKNPPQAQESGGVEIVEMHDSVPASIIEETIGRSEVSPVTWATGAQSMQQALLWTHFRSQHVLVQTSEKEKDGSRIKRRRCNICTHGRTKYYCSNVLCKGVAICCVNDTNRDCHRRHVLKQHPDCGLKI